MPPTQLGFKTTAGGAHAARTMMLQELTELLAATALDDRPDQLRAAVVEANVLGKRSVSTRRLTWSHLVDLYGMSPDLLLFRALTWFWRLDPNGHPLMALSAALARDGLLADIAPFVLEFPQGAKVAREAVEAKLEELHPQRFSPATLKSVAQNINSSLTQSGHLHGRASKTRVCATATAGSVALALLLGYASGARGLELFRTRYMAVQDVPLSRAMELAEEATRKGWLDLKRVADVVEVAFPRIIRPDELKAIHEQA
ncbi:hypothetical protein [uncultured Aquimonas sp.]|uniref:hypothetical protein n=1 Tax=uncultured Aquimonas sp. TaxID=385483 RepID=UPI00086833AC|nr:hypothetical protein [uncultured Aquimonas sp.]ODU42545.1 MAG: hypothetical protein ABS96_27595 [Xanthomonadaceae bacterium SCN 69-123]